MPETHAKERVQEPHLPDRDDEAAFEALVDTCHLDLNRLNATGYLNRWATVRADIARTYWWLAAVLYLAIIAFAFGII